MSDSRIRVYLPATLSTIATLRMTGGLPAPVEAHAVTPGIREWYAESDEEELEFVVFTRAAQSALCLLHDDPAADRRRAVISLDVPLSDVRPVSEELGSSLVEVCGEIPLPAVAAVHVDGVEAREAVEQAVRVMTAAAGGDDDAQFVVDGVEDYDLEWFDPSEIEHIA